MNYDPLYNPYPSRRNIIYAKKGMVATSQPLAAQAGLDMLKKGGNAIDAAIATAACLTVVEPTSNGIGGDAFALVWTKGTLHGLNASGPSPLKISIDAVKKDGYSTLPKYGMIPVNVPGAPSAWAALSKRFGKLSLKESLGPAIRYAEEGFPVSPIIGKLWHAGFETYAAEKEEIFKHWFEVFAPHGRPPAIGEVWCSPKHAESLQSIAETNAESFYRGELANKIDKFFNNHKGYLTKEDLSAFRAEWVDPIKINYRGYDVWEIPPNGHGLVALMALNILKGFDFSDREAVETYHKQIEAVKLAFADGKQYITDARKMTVKVKDLLSDSFATERRQLIGKTALQPEPGRPVNSGTVYLATADNDGNMVSYIQSNYMGFGSGLVVPGTGISLHNRGYNFSFDPEHDNRLEPGKKPYHTIIPGFLSKDNEAVGPFGVMGGFIQPQGHMMILMNMIDFHLNPQAALDAPRWQWTEGKTVEVDHLFPEHIAEALVRRGHIIKRGSVGATTFGRGQIILRNSKGVLAGATEPRTDGTVAAW
ncbi:MAG TPA: gamma-glutamyltransferase family protein [Nitrospirota bacterium]|nr:gamma-glutamyltransferase family protein [Nitrospirota bacterium]